MFSFGRHLRINASCDLRGIHLVGDSRPDEIRFLRRRLRRTVAWAIEVRHECASHHEAARIDRTRPRTNSLSSAMRIRISFICLPVKFPKLKGSFQFPSTQSIPGETESRSSDP